MNTESISLTSESAPPLFLALWSIRHRMEMQPMETFDLIKRLGFSAVEVPGFFGLKANDVQKQLKLRSLKICSLHGPLLRMENKHEFYSKWAKEYLEIFETNTVGFESSPKDFLSSEKSQWVHKYNIITDLVIDIAQDLAQYEKQVSYHCFPHDFEMFEEQPLISRLFAREDVPPNLGLQLDTFWLNHAHTEPQAYAALPVHSVHLNERDEEGHSCMLGTEKEKCAKYILPLKRRRKPINWILENDPVDKYEYPNDAKMIDIMHQCINGWPSFWHTLASSSKE